MARAEIARVAVVQVRHPLCASLEWPRIEEPAELQPDQIGIASLALNDKEHSRDLDALRGEVRQANENFVVTRLPGLLQRLDSMAADVVVFPEYSIPAKALSVIEKHAGSCSVIAGTHTVTPDAAKILKQLGIEVEREDIGIAICPIRKSNGEWARVDKLAGSHMERGLRRGRVWDIVSLQNRKNEEFSVAVLVCYDFINQHSESSREVVSDDVWSRVNLGIVCAHTTVTTDFDHEAEKLQTRRYIPIGFTNGAAYGGTRIYANFEATGEFHEHNATVAVPRGDEAVLLADVVLEARSPKSAGRGQRVPAPPTSELVSVLPILPEDAHKEFLVDAEALHELRERDDEMRSGACKLAAKFLSGSKSTRAQLPVLLRLKLTRLPSASKNKNAEDLIWLVATVATPDKPQLIELQLDLVSRARRFAIGVLDSGRFDDYEHEQLTRIEKHYLSVVDRLASDPSLVDSDARKTSVTSDLQAAPVQPLETDTDASAEEWASYFILRMRSARVDRHSLEAAAHHLDSRDGGQL